MELEEPKESIFKRIFRNLHYKYKLVVMNESTFEEKWSVRLSRMNVLIIYVLLSLFSVAFTIVIIWISPLKEYIPGYASVDQVKQVYINEMKADSLETEIRQRNLYIENFNKRILLGENLEENDSANNKVNKDIDYNNIPDKKSEQDSLLRKEWEEKEDYTLIYYPKKHSNSGITKFVFFTPLHGTVTNGFDAKNRHYAVDIIGAKDSPILATLDGTVIFTGWTYENGYVISIQHDDDLISVYKHNSTLLKSEGDMVKAGEPIAIIGNTGKFTSGPHLHFELWYHRKAVNPADFINFD